MSVTIRVSAKRFPRVLARLPKALETQMRAAMLKTAQFGRTAVQRTIASTRPLPVSTGTYRNSWEAKPTKDGAVLRNTTLQAYFVERGRRPGKRPPFAPLLRWVMRKTKRSGDSARSFAFLVQRKIAKKGTPKREVLKRTIPAMSKYLKTELASSVKATKAPK